MGDIKEIDTGSWIGDIRGAIVGNGFLNIAKEKGNWVAEISINNRFSVFNVRGGFKNSPPFEISLPSTSKEGQDKYSLNLKNLEFSDDGKSFSGIWEMSDGSKGVASFSKVSKNTTAQLEEPAQICAETEFLGAITLYFDEFKQLVGFLIQAFDNPPRPVIRFIHGKADVIKYSEEFFKDKNLPEKIYDCTLSAEEKIGAYKRSIIINFIKDEGARVFVQSEDQVWVSGTVQAFKRFFKQFTSFGSLLVKKYGLNLNGLLFLSFIILVPDLTLPKRLVFGGLLLLLMVIFFQTHKIIPYTTLYLSPKVKRWVFRHHWPSILSAMIGSFIFFLITQIFSFLVSGKFLNFLRFLENSFN